MDVINPIYWMVLLLLFSGCRTNAFTPAHETFHEQTDEEREKEITQLIFEKRFKEAEQKLRELLEKSKDKYRDKYIEKISTFLILSKIGLDQNKILEASKGKDNLTKINSLTDAASKLSQDDMDRMVNNKKNIEASPEKSKDDYNNYTMLSSLLIANKLGKTRNAEGKFDRDTANKNLSPEDSESMLANMNDMKTNFQLQGDTKNAESTEKEIEAINASQGPDLKTKLINFLEQREKS
jgi:hypothetical protein